MTANSVSSPFASKVRAQCEKKCTHFKLRPVPKFQKNPVSPRQFRSPFPAAAGSSYVTKGERRRRERERDKSRVLRLLVLLVLLHPASGFCRSRRT